MKNNNTKTSNAQSKINRVSTSPSYNAACDLKDCTDATSRFLNRFGVAKLLGECGAYKEKGVPVRVILLYIFNLMFSPMSMYYQIKNGCLSRGFL